MTRIQGASGPVTTGSFSHLSPVKLTSASSTGNSWHPPVTPEIRMGSVPLHPDGISIHCAPVSTKALNFSGSDVPGHQICTVQYTWSSLSSSWPKAETLCSCSWLQYSLSDLCGGRPEVPSPGSREVISVLVSGRSLIAFLCLSSNYTDSLLGWPFLNSCLPSQFVYIGFQLKGGFTIPPPHILPW